MKCVVITVVFPRMTGAGGKIAIYGVSASLKRAGHDVTILYCSNKKETGIDAEKRELNIIQCIDDQFGVRSMTAELNGLRPDIVWVYTTRSWSIYRECSKKYPVVLLAGDPRDQIEKYRFKWTSVANSRNPVKRFVAKMRLLRRIHSIRLEERIALREAYTYGVAAAYGPGDIDYIRKNAGVPVRLCQLSFPMLPPIKRNGDPNFLILGNFNTVHTRYGLEIFFNKIWPYWKRSILPSNSTIRIVGAGKLPKSLSIPKDTEGLKFVGFVEDLEMEFRSATAILVSVPLDIGFRTRVIEAWSRAIPVIMDEASAKGLPEVTDGLNCLVASKPTQWLDAAESVLRDNELSGKLAIGGRTTFEKYYFCDNVHASKRYADLSFEAINRWKTY